MAKKTRHANPNLRDTERNVANYLDDLKIALALMTKLSELFECLDEKKKVALLQILAKRIIVSPEGEIVDFELCLPFAYLNTLSDNFQSNGSGGSGSEFIRLRSPEYPHMRGIFLFLHYI